MDTQGFNSLKQTLESSNSLKLFLVFASTGYGSPYVQYTNKYFGTQTNVSKHFAKHQFTKVYFDTPQIINRYATRYFNTFEMTQQNVIRYTTNNCSQYATESLDAQQKNCMRGLRKYNSSV